MNIKVFIIHVSTQVERQQHMDCQLKDSALPFTHEYINEGDLKEITPAILDQYFADCERCQMHQNWPPTSCSYKHFLATKRLLDEQLEGALILEDDIYLHDNFQEIFSQTLQEYQQSHSDESMLISYEDSSLRFVKGSEKKRGQLLYIGNHDRYAGAYFINRRCAEAIVREVETNKMQLPIDCFHDMLRKQGKLNYYWCSPEIATQGSCNGLIPTLIHTKYARTLRLRWFFKYNIKKLIAALR